MALYYIENEILKATVRTKGAELTSIIKKDTGDEYLWNADKRFWGWSAPVLFPFVGALRDRQYSYKGKTYPMTQHGFARDHEFELLSQSDTKLLFGLSSTEEMRQRYPFDFCLEIGYALEKNSLKVFWNVENTGEEPMYFSIGAHPAFRCPLNGEGEQSDYYMGFQTDAPALFYRLIDPDCNLIDRTEYPLALENGLHRIKKDRFDKDALVIEGGQTHKMWLAKPDKTPYLAVSFDAPLFGVWSPAGKNAPFVCIEPWYGRSDANDFYGTLEEREYTNLAQPQEIFRKEYTITVC